VPICSECPSEVSGRAKTCSDACRAKRHRRIKRGRAEGTEAAADVELPKGAIDAAIQTTVQDAVAPIVREALTDDVLKGIRDLLNLTPKAIKAIEQDLESENDFIRQGAYRLLARYTLGHPSLVPEVSNDKNVVVMVNGIARPQGPTQPGEELAAPSAATAAVVETRQCDSCDEHKPVTEFVGTSHRCQACFTRMRDHAHSIGEHQ
jgi:hypothetical protein